MCVEWGLIMLPCHSSPDPVLPAIIVSISSDLLDGGAGRLVDSQTVQGAMMLVSAVSAPLLYSIKAADQLRDEWRGVYSELNSGAAPNKD